MYISYELTLLIIFINFEILNVSWFPILKEETIYKGIRAYLNKNLIKRDYPKQRYEFPSLSHIFVKLEKSEKHK